MARQIAYVITHWVGQPDTNGFKPRLMELIDAAQGENMMIPSEMRIRRTATTQDVVIVEVWAEEARLNLLSGSVHFIFSRVYEDAVHGSTGKSLDDPLSASEVSTLSTWLQNKTGKTVSQIAAWLDSTPAQISNWLQNHPRREAAKKLFAAWREWTD
jgi:hypothetical protein